MANGKTFSKSGYLFFVNKTVFYAKQELQPFRGKIDRNS